MKKQSLSLILCLIITYGVFAQTENAQQGQCQVTCMAFTPNDQKMVSGYEDGTIQVWNGEGKLILSTATDAVGYNNAKSKVSRLAISPDGKRIAACMDNYKTYLLDAKGKTIKMIDFDASYLGFSPDSRTLMMAYDVGHEVYCADSAGNKLNSFYTKPYCKNSKGNDPHIQICGIAIKPDNGVLILNKLEMNEKKQLYDYWIYDYDSKMNLINKTQFPFSPKIFRAKLSASDNCNKVYVGGDFSSMKEIVFEGFIYDASAGSVTPTSLNSGYDQFLTPEGDKMVMFSCSGVSVNNIATTVTDIVYTVPNKNYDDYLFASSDKQKIVVAYKNKPLQMHSLKTGKLFDFDNSKTVEDTYTYEPPKQDNVVSTSNPNEISSNQQPISTTITTESKQKIDLSVLSGLKVAEYTDSYADKFDIDFDRGDGGTTVWNISGVEKSDITASSIGSFITMYSLSFKANLEFFIADVSTRKSDYVSLNFWIRKIPNDSKGRYESYVVRAYQDGWVQLLHLEKDKETVLVSKNLIEHITFKTWEYKSMTVEATENGKISVFINDGYSPVINTDVQIANDGRPYELTALKSSSAGLLQNLHVTGNKIVKQRIKVEKPKAVESTLTGCVAGDCFYGFGYLIEPDGKTEYIGYFKNGVREGLGQIHLAADNVLYNGYFANDMPNGYGCTLFYAKKITEIGTYTNTMKDGDFTTHYPTTTVVAKWKDEVKLSSGRQTGCISGDCTNGKGIVQNENGSRIDGSFVNGKKVSGVQFWENGQVQLFEKKDSLDQFQGNVDIFFQNGEAQHCIYKDGKPNGKMLSKMGIGKEILYVEAMYVNGKATDATVHYRDGRIWVGKQDPDSIWSPWVTGIGTMTYTDGTTKTGKFKDGEFVSE
ncbi:hypothetical protein CYCD_24920 [Tenuifilaceae bacterium CYCD]|nr:hypothetical protein CYCD_24920 [Tenuifilaceae bacterium CYCD]